MNDKRQFMKVMVKGKIGIEEAGLKVVRILERFLTI
jgi:hypothetical protein